ncbi:sigma-54-dependent Fis family transcriptional regulator [Desulfocurvibacter africanus]|uniref:Transcriptional regulator, NifA, Fis Family n=2 Tax=Desulfocurvibacter africanus TaxID=873 RepID=F3YVR9_DESAF|nr:sigma-54-dependent Fis family transcriptional regulator [Desulfocurvibacter africanus]EGJ48877.1 transcriptional regulator, NifA, Fis Family [Desulfocurvibacter africanus subsp. africanus str. Walvis Bay]EMG36503.1 transcriptional regulator containing GAF, AAA-type ATPase, and DNA binding domain containing protein [Desulfocurvibacter africanus PCS]
MTSIGALELKVLFEIANIIGHALDLERTLEEVLRILSDSMSMKRATITLLDDNGQLVIRASHGLSAEEKQRGVYRLNEGITGRIFSTAKPFVVPDIHKEPLFLDKTRSRQLEKDRISFLGVPILLQDKPVGVLNVDRLFGDEISFEEDVRFLTIVATLIGQFYSLVKQVQAREERLKRENVNLRSKLSKNYQRFFIVGKSPSMLRVRQMIEKVAPTRATVLLLGESGTGKTLAAQFIHELSDRNSFPFIKVNCAAIPENLLESELFGHEKGAFTGATNIKPGRIEEADKGSLFLDEIGEISPGIQAKLLRFLQEREFERLGSTRTRKVDVRIIAATNRDLTEAVREGDFREDLFYRLNVFPIRVPSLRERADDISALINHFLDKLDREYGRRLTLRPRALEALLRYDWPGNVREMENLLERLSIMVEDTHVDLEDIPPNFFLGSDIAQPRNEEQSSLQEIERREVVSALERHNWVQSRAARELGITLRQMGYRIKKFDLENLLRERRGQGRMSLHR